MADSQTATPQPAPTPPPAEQHAEQTNKPAKDSPSVAITVSYAGHTHTFSFESDAVLDDLVVACGTILGAEYDWPSAKFIAPKVGLLKASDKPDFPLAPLHDKKLNLMVPKAQDISDLRAAEERNRAFQEYRERRLAQARRNQRSAHHHRHGGGDAARAAEESTYTFLQLRPLPQFPDPERSLAFLRRLRDDPGIRAAMRRHKFTVGLLTEMDPASYTESSHEGTTRILGLNRNQGEVIELRLRTDAYDGYRDYRTIRKTLCHELAHNVHGPHDRNFWDLCHQIEREVERGDWKSGGRTVVEGEFAPERSGAGDEEEVMDHGGWTGGEFVLGGGEAGSSSSSSAAGSAGEPLSRREILRRAAEERIRKMNAQMPEKGNGEGGNRSS
ncbi:Ubiquitin and WLM domain-containing metalloprotease [Pleurostoma richardsiae]|uniref:Ubiquitin and WLM domain-containing metalloprotease n=1 Tax=Pleurostoma richardsiae TaxID=41990 RepID=A0AA38VFU0_9PEZI|nr:Ubiquitin and WLM domain-containing metalloprotease [Pleurostoma richardsiae]